MPNNERKTIDSAQLINRGVAPLVSTGGELVLGTVDDRFYLFELVNGVITDFVEIERTSPILDDIPIDDGPVISFMTGDPIISFVRE